MADANDAFQVAVRVGSALAASDIPYAIGGALALGIWAEPRGTRDVDVTAFVAEDELERLFSTLQALDAAVDRGICRWQLTQWGHFEVEVDQIRVDVFLPDMPLYDWAFTRRRPVRSGSAELWYWSAEDTLLFKLFFFREKDLLDLKKLIAVQGHHLDLAYIRKALHEILDDEERTSWFEKNVREILGP